MLSLRIFSPPRRQITLMRNMKNLSRELAQKIEDLRAKMNEVAACKGTNDAEFVALNEQMDELVNQWYALQKIGAGVTKGCETPRHERKELLYDKTIRKLLKERGMTQRELAFHISVSPDHVSKILAGKENPSVTVLARIADVLGVSVEELMEKGNFNY